MTKTLSVAALFLLVLSVLPSCKKCYTCTNTCTICTLDSAGVVKASQTLYSDSLTTYASGKDSLIAHGYTCKNTKPTYSIDFCVNTKSAEINTSFTMRAMADTPAIVNNSSFIYSGLIFFASFAFLRSLFTLSFCHFFLSLTSQIGDRWAANYITTR